MTDQFDIFDNPGNSGLSDLSKTAKHGSYAYFPGTGPNKSCGDCEHFLGAGRDAQCITDTGFCREYQNITGQKGGRIKRVTKACREFEKRTRDVPPESPYKPLK